MSATRCDLRELASSGPVPLDVADVLKKVPPHLLGEQIVAEAQRLAGVRSVSLYLIDIDGTRLRRAAGSRSSPRRSASPARSDRRSLAKPCPVCAGGSPNSAGQHRGADAPARPAVGVWSPSTRPKPRCSPSRAMPPPRWRWRMDIPTRLTRPAVARPSPPPPRSSKTSSAADRPDLRRAAGRQRASKL